MGVIAGLTAVVGALVGVFTQVTVQKLVDSLDEMNAKGKNLGASDIVSFVNRITNLARAKGTKAINILNERLGSLSLPIGTSPAVKEAIMNNRRELSKDLRNAQEIATKAEATLTSADNAASALAAQPSSVRNEQGKGYLNRITNDPDFISAVNDLDQLNTNIERKVNEN